MADITKLKLIGKIIQVNTGGREMGVTGNPYLVTTSTTSNLKAVSHESYTSTTANDIDKTRTIPSGQRWLIKSVYADYTPGTTGADRYVEATYTDSAGNILAKSTTSTTMVKTTQRFIEFAPGNAHSTGQGSVITAPLPEGALTAGQKIRVRAVNAVATDDLTIGINYVKTLI